MSVENMSVCAVIVTYNSEATIRSCLEAVGSSIPTIVVDNASKDNTVAEVASRFPAIPIIRNTANLGLSKAINIGAAATRGDAIAIVNPDVLIEADDLLELSSLLIERPTAGLIAPKLCYSGGDAQDSARTFPSFATMVARRTPLGKTRAGQRISISHSGLAGANPTGLQAVDWVLGAVLVVRRAAFERLGGFDEMFFLYEEDIDFCARLWLSGWEVLYCPAISAQHDYQRASRKTFQISDRVVRAHWRSIARLTKKYPAQLILGRRLPRRMPTSPT